MDEFLKAFENAPPEQAVKDYIRKVDDGIEKEVESMRAEYLETMNRLLDCKHVWRG